MKKKKLKIKIKMKMNKKKIKNIENLKLKNVFQKKKLMLCIENEKK